MPPKNPTVKQYLVLEAITKFIAAHGYGPMIDEIIEMTGLTSKGMVYFYMQKLERENLISWEKSKSRTIQLVAKGPLGKKIDQRKFTAAELSVIKSAAGRKGKGENALTRKSQSLRDDHLQERIDMVVEMAQGGTASKDVFLIRGPFFRNGRVTGCKCS